MAKKSVSTFPINKPFVQWLEADYGRAAKLASLEPTISPATISKIRHGVLAISMESAIKIERAQIKGKFGDVLNAESLCTYSEDKELIKYLRPK